jgi:hypothetical protein
MALSIGPGISIGGRINFLQEGTGPSGGYKLYKWITSGSITF